MNDESRMRRVLQQEAGSVVPDVPEALQRVHGLAHRRTARRRGAVAIAAAAAAVTAVAGLGGALATLHRAAPTPATSDLSKVTLSIVKERSDADLGIGRALSVAVGAHGHVYVTDSSQHVTELSADLRRLRSWGGHGAATGRFRLIQGSIAVGPRGQVYVSDAGNFRVQEFTSTGKFVGQMGSFGTGPGQFTWPFDLAVDPGGNVYVADDRAQTLTKLTPSGRQVWRRGGLGLETDPRLRGHQHLSGFDPSGRLLTVNDDAGVVLLWNPAGEVIGGFGTQIPSAKHTADTLRGSALFPRGACDATVDAAGRIYVTSCEDVQDPHWYGIFLPNGTLVGSRSDSTLVESPRWGQDGRGYAVTSEGGVAEVKSTAP